MKSKTCSVCGSQFGCGPDTEKMRCWCADYPPIMPLDFSQDCRCPVCLKIVVQEKIGEYLQTVTPENAKESIAKDFATKGEHVEGIDYYINEDGYFVFTAWFHLKRGSCCSNGCKHCPYGFLKA